MHPKWMDEKADLGKIETTILNGTDPGAIKIAIEQLDGEEPDDALRILTTAATVPNPDPGVRAAIVEALGDYVEDIPPVILEPALHDPDPTVRFEALSVLADMNQPDALAAIRSALSDKNQDVRDLAEGILGFRG